MKRWLVLLLLVCSPAFAQLPTTPLGNATVAGTLGVTGATTLNGTTAANAPINLTPNGGTIARSVQATLADVVNVLSYAGVDRTGATDSSAGINAAVAYGLTFTPAKAVYIPSGIYHVANAISLGSSTQPQCIEGDGATSVINVGPDFNPSATGVILPVTLGQVPSQSGGEHCIKNLNITFSPLVNLITTASAQSLTGVNTITVASTAGIVPGNVMYVTDSNNSAIPILLDTISISSRTGTRVVSVNNGTNVVTLSTNLVGTVNIGDTITFASVRSRYSAMGACTITAGGTGCKYPWAINTAGTILIENINVVGAWDGVQIVGSQWTVNNLAIGALDDGLHLDQAFGFPTLTNYLFGQNAAGFGGTANEQAFYDGNTYAAIFDTSQGLGVTNFQTFAGKVQLNLNNAWVLIDNLMLDGSNANLEVNGGWAKIGNMYSTKGDFTQGTPISVTGGRTDISNIYFTSTNNLAPSVAVSGGSLSIMGGYTWYGTVASPFMAVTGGELDIGDVQLDAGGVTGGQYYVQQSGANGVLKVNGAKFISAAQGISFGITTDNAADQVTNVSFNGWLFASPGPLGAYGPNSISVLIADALFDTALGTNAGHSITTGNLNTFFGYQAGQMTTTGVNNTYVGTNAGLSNTTGTWNTAVGVSALQVGTVTAGNAAFGMYALTSATGTSNTALGFQAGKSLTTGGNNTIVGNSVASTTLTTGSDNILIGTTSGLDTAAAGTSNTISIGNIFTATGTNVPATSIASVSGAFGVTGVATLTGGTLSNSLLPIGTTLALGSSVATVINIGNSGSTTTITGSIVAGTSAGLSCSGTPSSGFTTVNGIVTHC